MVLSFDDGYRSDFSVVAPLLKELDWPAVLDLIVRNTWPGQDMRASYVRALILWPAGRSTRTPCTTST